MTVMIQTLVIVFVFLFISEYQEAFSLFDRNGDGHISGNFIKNFAII